MGLIGVDGNSFVWLGDPAPGNLVAVQKDLTVRTSKFLMAVSLAHGD
jgi:hypothetical protein